ncbi:aldose 1-epimerase [Enterococcus sp. AZ194]|uniref:aldose epimerase family protein n=1 Tax=Enterococcus sp. AZ194 TaxID=2774629 RepID=UPI003F1F2148
MEISRETIIRSVGPAIEVYALTNSNKIRVELSNYGASVLSIYTPDSQSRLANIVLGFKDATDYLATRSYFGATVGRVAGRISYGEGRLSDSSKVDLSKNDPPHHLHGGFVGLDNQFWVARSYKTREAGTVVFSLLLPDKMEGYPGNLMIQTYYTLTNENQLIIKYRAYSDRETLFNPTNHMYFNLSGSMTSDISTHRLSLASDFYTPITVESIPTGAVRSVKNSVFDLNQPKILAELIESQEQSIIEQGGVNHPWILRSSKEPILLSDPKSGRRVKIQTDQPAVVLYSGNHFNENPFLLKQGMIKHGGLAIECQALPDAGKYPEFGTICLKGNTFFESNTIYTFDIDKPRKEEKK